MERIYYKVQFGDTLYSIAQKFECTVPNLRRWNGIRGDALEANRTIMVGIKQEPKALYFPIAPSNRYNNNVGQFLDNAYYRIIGAVHPGNDINGNGGGDTDFNDPVYNIADGIVVDAAYYPVWGNIVAIYHEHLQLESIYAHLNSMDVKKGDKVNGGQKIGRFGKGAGNRYITHLHFELRKRFVGIVRLPTPFWPSTKYPNKEEAERFVMVNYIDAWKYLNDQGALNVKV